MSIQVSIARRAQVLCVAGLTVFAASMVSAQKVGTLCKDGERVIVSFEVSKSKKTASVCEGPESQYITYRFGTQSTLELEFPSMLDKGSWSKFQYKGYFRGGGIENDSMGDYTLSFSNKDAEYTIAQSWRLATKEYNLGILVEAATALTVLNADQSTQSGSLELLNGNPNVKNRWGAE